MLTWMFLTILLLGYLFISSYSIGYFFHFAKCQSDPTEAFIKECDPWLPSVRTSLQLNAMATNSYIPGKESAMKKSRARLVAFLKRCGYDIDQLDELSKEELATEYALSVSQGTIVLLCALLYICYHIHICL